MKEISVSCDYTILDNFKYEIYENCELTMTAHVDLYSPLLDFFKKGNLYQSKITVNEGNREIISIFKLIQVPISNELYTITIGKENYSLKQRKSYRIPDFYIDLSSGNLSLRGMINIQSFEIYYNKVKCASIRGKIVKNKKVYTLKYEHVVKNSRELFLSLLLIIDNLYHDY
ncbi:hypothetical protein [Anaerosphaera multitolerans]|uniref:Uncharacterized protein n=1 Tax=Anaerosphaera multitolerans TaxID=2487351 RepID=A0A437S8U1_9FIRM|nr:hypothetical protein [Anaerosphaera multitolerans]RVU55520.1 hypothetical protein EF514_01985 [Anaerosphaera multitolerans]